MARPPSAGRTNRARPANTSGSDRGGHLHSQVLADSCRAKRGATGRPYLAMLTSCPPFVIVVIVVFVVLAVGPSRRPRIVFAVSPSRR